ncbi:MAG: nucleotidyltransferase domain-containing protein [Chitinivibrionia bacterium]|nr:nucleotidyltransferase domain-containing protein [Chitinivibrionia bacterium]
MSVRTNGNALPLEAGMDPSRLEAGAVAATFEGLVTRSPFVVRLRSLLRTLEECLEYPVEIEFASDGEQLYLLQCRPQSLARKPRPAPIPKDIPAGRLVFSANRYVLNGQASNITHIVYVDPDAYARLEGAERRRDVARAVARLNTLLPKRQFILMCAGRWADAGRGPGDMGISYGDFKHAAVLIELMPAGGARDPVMPADVHFLQEIAESGILYLPLFGGDEGAQFDEQFFRRSPNILAELLPEYGGCAGAVRVIDVFAAAEGDVMQVRMNAELGEAVGFLSSPEQEIKHSDTEDAFEEDHAENYWRWRYRMAEQIAAHADPAEFGIAGMYVFGSTKNGTAGPASDIDMLVHFRGTPSQRKTLAKWLEGWSLCLDEINYLRTGYRSGGLLDFHIVTDGDIARKTSYAVKINAITDAARPLRMKQAGDGVASGPDAHA